MVEKDPYEEIGPFGTPSEPPPLGIKFRSIPRGNLEEEAVAQAIASITYPSSTVSPPPLEVRQRNQKSNTASQTGSNESGATSVSKRNSSGSRVPQNASKRHSETTESAPKQEPQIEHVYLVVGMDHDQDSVHLCKIATDLEFKKSKKGIAEFYTHLISNDYNMSILGAPGFEHICGDTISSIHYSYGSPIDLAKGIVWRGEISNEGDPVYERRERDPDDHDEDDDWDDDDEEEIVGYENEYIVYSWVVVKCKLGEVGRIDLNSLFD